MFGINKRHLRMFALLLAVFLATAVPAAAMAESFSAAVKVKSMKVYADANGKQYLGSLPKKTIVTVEDYSGGVALISYNGMTGYAKVADMSAIASFAKKATTNQSTRIYTKPRTDSASISVGAGMQLNVLAVSKGVAMVEKNGNVGYVYAGHLNIGGMLLEAVEDDSAANDLESIKDALESQTPTPSPTAQPETIEQAFTSGKYSNEQLTFAFAVKVMGLNHAAAAGLLANVSAESGFKPDINGDSGTSYGICQWHASRKTRLFNWCENKGVDPSELASQLYFLKYELETYYPSVLRYMKNVGNDGEGAYDAAYYFCFNFEAPANKASKSTSRAKSAQNIFYPRYANSLL